MRPAEASIPDREAQIFICFYYTSRTCWPSTRRCPGPTRRRVVIRLAPPAGATRARPSPARPTATPVPSPGSRTSMARPVSATRPPEPWEKGLKDSVIALPGQVTRVRGAVHRARPVRLALPHRRARGQRDDAAVPHRAGAAGPANVDPHGQPWGNLHRNQRPGFCEKPGLFDQATPPSHFSPGAAAHPHLPRGGWPPLHGCQWKPHCVILALTQSRRFVVEKVSLSSSLTCLLSGVSAGRLNCVMISASGML